MIVAGAIGGRGVDDGELAGLEPDAGQITWRRDLRLEYVTQEPRFAAGVTIGELLARDGDVPAHEASTIAAALQLPAEDRRVDQLSGGERRRVALARALLGKADLLALDEPTNHLDARTVEWLEQRLGNYPGAVLVVTHDRYFLDRVVTRVVELDRGQVYSHDGDYSSFLLAQAERLATEADTEHKRAMFVRREIEWVRRSPGRAQHQAEGAPRPLRRGGGQGAAGRRAAEPRHRAAGCRPGPGSAARSSRCAARPSGWPASSCSTSSPSR
jgi:ATPase subunit of ABC transporter with duplicated ATPase domains